MRSLIATLVLTFVLGACSPAPEPTAGTEAKDAAVSSQVATDKSADTGTTASGTADADSDKAPAEPEAKEDAPKDQGGAKKPMDTTLDKIAPEDMPKDGEEVGILDTAQGRIVIRFYPDSAPAHVENWKTLAKKGFYDGTRFHRVIPRFMVQGGDPNSKSDNRGTHGTGGPGYTIPAEFNDIKHTRGIVSAARTQDPNSAGSQFFLMVAAYPSLDNQYSVFGKVISGMGNVDKIVALKRDDNDNPLDMEANKVIKASVEKWPLK